MGVGGGASSKLKKAARKMVVAACASFSFTNHTFSASPDGSDSIAMSPTTSKEAESNSTNRENSVPSKNLCAICLEALTYSTGNSPGQAIFTAQCSHTFHFACISSNVRHGSVTCPICRAHWTQLPRNLNRPCSLYCNQTDPIFQILDDSIANFRVHRRSFLRSARYNDDDPIEPDHTSNHPRLHFSLVPLPPKLCHHPFTYYPYHHHHHHHHPSHLTATPSSSSFFLNRSTAAFLSVKSTHRRAIDLVLVASPTGPHLRLVKQSMALVVFSLRPVDRLAIVTYSSSAARVFPLRRMTSYGKRTALQVIERLFFMGQADPTEGLKKAMKILDDRAHKNPQSSILHLSDCPTRSYHAINMQVPIPLHRFHVGFGFGTSNGFVMHEFEVFLVRLLGGVIKDVQLGIGEEGRILRLGELRDSEERRILLDLDECRCICVRYSYTEGGVDECTRTGDTLVSLGEKREAYNTSGEAAVGRDLDIISGRTSSVEGWDYHDPYMARRWAKHLHSYRL